MYNGEPYASPNFEPAAWEKEHELGLIFFASTPRQAAAARKLIDTFRFCVLAKKEGGTIASLPAGYGIVHERESFPAD